MAKRRRTNTSQRDDPNTSLEALLALPDPPLSPVTYTQQTITELEDRRAYHPARQTRPLASLYSTDRKLVVPKQSRPLREQALRLPSALSFNVPKQVSLCVRRKQRREVIFALNKRRKGSSARRRRNQYSNIGC